MEANRTQRSGAMLVGVLGCAGVAALGLVCLEVVRASRASTSLERRALDLRGELAAWRARPTTTTRPARGGTVIEGDAVDRYAVALWLLEDDPAPAPTRGSTTLERVRGVDLDAALARALEAVEEGRPLDADVMGALAAHAPVVALLREGLRCGSCDWRLDVLRLEPGPDVSATLRAAKLLALAAEREADGGEAARGCLDVVAFGADVVRTNTFFGGAIGASVKEVGLEALQRVLDARRLSPEQYAEIVEVLRVLGQTDVRPALEAERLGLRVAWASISGHPVTPGPRDSLAWRLEHLGLMGPTGYEREWVALDAAFARLLEAAAREPGLRGDELDRLRAAAEASGSIVVNLLVRGQVWGLELVDAANLLAGEVRLKAALIDAETRRPRDAR
jgi:hypothetical protein